MRNTSWRWRRPAGWGGFLVTFPDTPPREWDIPTGTWHWDGPPDGRGLLIFSFYSDVGPGGGGTLLLRSSQHLVADYYASLDDETRALPHAGELRRPSLRDGGRGHDGRHELAGAAAAVGNTAGCVGFGQKLAPQVLDTAGRWSCCPRRRLWCWLHRLHGHHSGFRHRCVGPRGSRCVGRRCHLSPRSKVTCSDGCVAAAKQESVAELSPRTPVRSGTSNPTAATIVSSVTSTDS